MLTIHNNPLHHLLFSCYSFS